MNTILKVYDFSYMLVSIGSILHILITLAAKSIISKIKETKGNV